MGRTRSFRAAAARLLMEDGMRQFSHPLAQRSVSIRYKAAAAGSTDAHLFFTDSANKMLVMGLSGTTDVTSGQA